MLRPTLLLIAAFACLGAAPAGPAAKKAPAPPAKAAVAKPSATRPAGAPFDATDPMSLIALLGTVDAKGEIANVADDSVFLRITTPAYAFGGQYAGCDARGKACKALAFSTVSETRRATLIQLNGFNQTSLTCRAFQDRVGKPHVAYGALVAAQDSRDAMRSHLAAWQGCLATFGEFLNDPNAYLASAP